MNETHIFFLTHPVFTRQEFAAARTARSRASRAVDAMLGHHVRAGRIHRIRRGLYAAVPPGMSPADTRPDPVLVASRAAQHAVLGYETALELHGLAHAPLLSVTAITPQANRPLDVDGVRIRFVRPPVAVRRAAAYDFGTTSTVRGGIAITLTGLERTVVDALDRPELAGGADHVWESLTTVPWLDADGAVTYATLLQNRTTAAKLGLFLSRHRKRLRVPEKQIERLRAMRPSQPHYVERMGVQPMRLVSEWNLLVPRRWSDEAMQG